MTLKRGKSTSPGQRHRIGLDFSGLTKKKPEKRLRKILTKHSGRNNTGKITTRHKGGRHKRFLRIIDFKRDKRNMPATVVSIEYDPNRTANIALLVYPDGEKRYILAPEGLLIGQKVEAGEKADLKMGNALPLAKIPVGMPIHNIELKSGRGGQIARSAGNSASIQAKEGGFANILMPSTEIRKISLNCYATLGQISNQDWKTVVFAKAGRKRHMGIRPTVRGVAQHPGSHPHGGGEGRSGIGMSSPKTPWGKKAMGVKTRNKKKYSNKHIITRRKK